MLRSMALALLLCASVPAEASDADQAVELLKASLQCAVPPRTYTDAYNATHRVLTIKTYTGSTTVFTTASQSTDNIHDKSAVPMSDKTGNELWSITETHRFSAAMSELGTISTRGPAVVIECLQPGKQCFEDKARRTIHWPPSHCAVQSACGGPDVDTVQRRYKKLTLNLCDADTASNVRAALEALVPKRAN